MNAALTSAEAWLRPLDRARTAVFVRALAVRPLRSLLLDKRRRVLVLLSLHAAVAFVLSVLAPTLLLVLGPLLLGVPHLLADLRYLALRAPLTTSTRAWLLGGAALLLALKLAELLGVPSSPRFELALSALWVAGSAVLGASRIRDARLLLVAALIGLWVTAAWLAPATVRLFMAHAHNPLALVIWSLLFRRARPSALAISALILGAALVLLGSPLAWLGFQHGLRQSFGLHGFVAADQLAPFASSAPRALGVVASFAFLQSVHYAVWLHAIPQEATPGEGTLTFRMSYRALRQDLGAAGLALAALLVVLLPLAGAVAPLSARSVYLSLATFHGYLELGALVQWWLRRPRSTCAHQSEGL